jgi:transposase
MTNEPMTPPTEAELRAWVELFQTLALSAQAEVVALRAQVGALKAQVTGLETQVEELGGLKAQVGALSQALKTAQAAARQPKVKASRPQRPEDRPPRQRRPHGFARRRDQDDLPVEVIHHYPDCCPHCQTTLTGGWRRRTREVIDLPPIQAIRTQHVIYARHCPTCERTVVAKPDLTRQVIGQQRFGVGLMTHLAYLKSVGRLPLAVIQAYLRSAFGVKVSHGELVELLKTVAKVGQPTLTAIRQQIRASPVVCVDETSWREDGVNVTAWTYCTPTERVVVSKPTRGTVELKAELLDGGFDGVLMSDCYAVYAAYDGPHAKCWAHLGRDLDDLVKHHPEDAAVTRWAWQVRLLLWVAKRWRERHPAAEPSIRRAVAGWFDERLQRLCLPHLQAAGPLKTLCQRLERYGADWFGFVADDAIPTTNNLAERTLRPIVVDRKITGGTRSAAGSETRFALASLFATWHARDQDRFAACYHLLSSPQL